MSAGALARFRASLIAVGLSFACWTVSAATNAVSQAGLDFFESKVRPVLAENCYRCHSHHSEKVHGGFMLDTRDDLLKGGDSGAAIVPGRPEDSLLIKAIGYEDPDLKMPPKNHKLSDAQIEDLREWVKMGAPDPREAGASVASQSLEAARKHWAFQPITEPAVPKVRKLKKWISTPLDAFILENLQAKNLHPSPPADKRALIRRATFDLTGLPPTPEEVDAFLADRSKDAFATVVDRLLASPRYGERWGRYWLDVARYADTSGSASGRDSARLPYAYTYRDYVIRACNEDEPVNQFILEQLAADQLPASANEHRNLAALGFLTVGRRFSGNENDIIDDRIDVVSRGLLGLTVNCARCHDHKFDPIPARDYYSLHGVFNSSAEPPDLPLLTAPPSEAYTNYLAKIQATQAMLDDCARSNEVAVIENLRRRVGDYLLAVHDAAPLASNSVAEDDLVRERGLHKSVYLSWKTNLAQIETNHGRLFAPWKALAAGASKYTGADLNPFVARAFSGRVFANLEDAASTYNQVFSAIGTGDDNAIELIAFAEAPDSPLNPPRAELTNLNIIDDSMRDRIDALRGKLADIEATDPGAPPRAMVLLDKPHPANSKVFLRGNPETRGPEAPREFLSILAQPGEQPFPEKASGRLQLAEDIVSPQNPLTARVFVNRVWMHHFGAPLVSTPGDFGLRSERPLQAGLLDYMAARFMRDGWSLKKLHRLIMLSSVYQQASTYDAAVSKTDPDNTRYWRMNPVRLDFEAMRDSLLSVAGELDFTVGGHPVDITSNTAPARRTVYAYIDRQKLPSLFRTFDFADPNTSTPGRFETIVAPQALYLLNGPLISQCARAVAAHCGASSNNAAATVARMYRLLFQRQPTGRELELAEEYAREQPSAAAVEPATSAWDYGAGFFDDSSQRTKDFQKLSNFRNGAWTTDASSQARLGFVQLNAAGGIPGKASVAAIRRWIAPRDGVISISGELATKGAGQGLVVSSRLGLLNEWQVRSGAVMTTLDNIEVREGDTIDFMVEALPGMRANYFEWAPRVLMARTDAETTGLTGLWDARENFLLPGTQVKPLATWDKFAQVLLISNEFFFIN